MRLAFTNRPAKRSPMREIPTKLPVPPLHSLGSSFGRTGCNNFTMPKAKTKGSKKRNGGSSENSDGQSAKQTMLSEMKSIRVRTLFLHVLVAVLLFY